MAKFIINPKLLKEYRCPACNKLLAKGIMTQKDDFLEVKCRGCKSMCHFYGEHAKVLIQRAKLIKQGVLPDTE